MILVQKTRILPGLGGRRYEEAGDRYAVPGIIAKIIPFDDNLALAAADIGLHEKLAMADAIIVATAQAYNCQIISSNVDLKDQANVHYIAKNRN